jgi:5-hydroxyisourate hydrolase
VVCQFLLCQLGAGVQTVLDDGLGQRFDDGVGGGRFHRPIIAESQNVYTLLVNQTLTAPGRQPPTHHQGTTMGLSTHVLDTMHGTPAVGMAVELHTTQGETSTLVKRFVLNTDGRNPDGLLYDNASLKTGTYRLVFDVAGYFKSRGVALPEPPFLNKVSLDFGVADASAHYHVPLLASPWSYSTYRGS